MKPLLEILKVLLPAVAAIVSCLVVSSQGAAQQSPDSQIATKTKCGFWCIERDDDGVWWFVSPTGQREFLNTVTTVSTKQDSRQKDGAGYRSKDWNGSTDPASLKTWAEKTAQRIADAGFKGIGAWSDHALHDTGLPISRDLNLWSTVSGGPDIFDPAWEAAIFAATKAQVEKLRDNPNIVGYYTDNELDWEPVSVGPRVYFDGRKQDDPNRLEVLKVIRRTWTTLDELNREWNSSFSSWEQLNGLSKLPRNIPKAVQKRLDETWLEHLSIRYFSVTSAAIRKYDPNHLILGVRFKGYAPPQVVRASRGYTDAQSINVYHEDGKLTRELFEMLHRESGQPVVISEYSFHSLDGRSGNRNECGFPAQVADQAARAEGYKVFTSNMARVPYIIGADWFQWNDEPPAGRGDGEDVNFGVVDIYDAPYEQLVKAIKETAPKLNPLHAESHKPNESVWRTSRAQPITAQLPHVTGIKLDGDISDWPDTARFQDVRRTETIGSRSSSAKPAVFAGWNENGLLLAFDVADSNINCEGLKSSWWTKDCIEIWLWLGDAKHKRPAEFDRNSCQFVLLPIKRDTTGGTTDVTTDGTPNATPAGTTSGTPAGTTSETPAGELVQWHRPGDALSEHLAPHPTVKQYTKLTKDGYTVEIFIPTSVLLDWKPSVGATLGFNFHVQDTERAAKFFWSSNKGADTQTRPETWGSLTLTK